MAVWLFLVLCCVSATVATPGDVVVLNTTMCDNSMGSLWANWASWTTPEPCSANCIGETGQFRRNRTRICSFQQNGCDVDQVQVELYECEGTDSPVDGMFSHWSSWSSVSPCPYLCGRRGIVVQERRRDCDNPEPSCGGVNCRGAKRRVRRRVCRTSRCGRLCSIYQGRNLVLTSPTISGNFLVCRRGAVQVVPCPPTYKRSDRLYRFFRSGEVRKIRQVCGI